MTINITVQRVVDPLKWHICGNNACENCVFGYKSVCLRCWCAHSLAHGDGSEAARYNYFKESL